MIMMMRSGETEGKGRTVIKHEGEDTRETRVAAHHHIELALPLGLLVRRRGAQVERGHVLHDDQSERVRRVVEQVRLDFDVFAPAEE
jgi:hypothetical protein